MQIWERFPKRYVKMISNINSPKVLHIHGIMELTWKFCPIFYLESSF